MKLYLAILSLPVSGVAQGDSLAVTDLFEDPENLSQHINDIWVNLDDWWNLDKVKKARTNFSQNFANYQPNLTSKIYNLIKTL